jgi:AcrR family transcriptional regulator
MTKAARHAISLPAEPKRADNRRDALLDAAAKRFAGHGYEGASMRDIAGDVGMLAGSMYYHFPSKEELLFAVHKAGVSRFEAAVAGALEGKTGPWERLEAAAVAHLQTLLSGGDYTQVVIRELPRDNEELRARLIALRDDYEAQFRALIDELPLAKGTDRSMLRLLLMGGLNWSQSWYGAGRKSPAQIAASFLKLLRAEL